MLTRYWIIAIAFGLIASLGQAQEETGNEQGQTSRHQEQSKTFPITIPVVIVEDHAAADARQRSEEEARQREIADLAAQQGMNAATQAMNSATQDMRDYAFYSTILVGIGTVLLIITLLVTVSANKAAREAVSVTSQIGQRQLRAYVHIFAANIAKKDSTELIASLVIKNFGQTPAYKMKVVYEFVFGQKNSTEIPIEDIAKLKIVISPTLAPGQSFDFTHTLPDEMLSRVNELPADKNAHLRMIGRITYVDAFDAKRETRFSLETKDGRNIVPGPFSISEVGNRSD